MTGYIVLSVIIVICSGALYFLINRLSVYKKELDVHKKIIAQERADKKNLEIALSKIKTIDIDKENLKDEIEKMSNTDVVDYLNDLLSDSNG